MSEIAPPRLVEDAAVAGPSPLSDILADFRRWYDESVADNGQPPAPAPPAIDLATLLGHFVALRQEVNLQTRSVRAQQEQTLDFARAVQQALEGLARTPAAPKSDNDDLIRPLLKSLVDVYDAIASSGQQIQKARTSLLPLLTAGGPEPPVRRSFWQRVFGSRQEAAVTTQKSAQGMERIAAALDALVTGYTMSLERIDRALRQHGLEPIAAVGQPFDPERMEALDTIQNSGRPSGEVVEEVRRGYLLNGRVFREAQVRVARD
jgi:molecular chaperone GrpE